MTTIGEDSREALHDTIRAWTAEGWRIESELPDQVVLVCGHRVNHLLHFVIGLVTLTVWWWLVWIPLGIFGGERRRVIGIDPVTGDITKRKL